MTVEEIIGAIHKLPIEERDKLFLAIMEDFKDDMLKNPEFLKHATAGMGEYMKKMREGGIDVSIFEAIAKK